MKPQHPFILLAPYFALAAFGFTALTGLLSGSDPLWLTVRAIAAFLLVNWVTRVCAGILASLSRPTRIQVGAEARQESD